MCLFSSAITLFLEAFIAFCKAIFAIVFLFFSNLVYIDFIRLFSIFFLSREAKKASVDAATNITLSASLAAAAFNLAAVDSAVSYNAAASFAAIPAFVFAVSACAAILFNRVFSALFLLFLARIAAFNASFSNRCFSASAINAAAFNAAAFNSASFAVSNFAFNAASVAASAAFAASNSAAANAALNSAFLASAVD